MCDFCKKIKGPEDSSVKLEEGQKFCPYCGEYVGDYSNVGTVDDIFKTLNGLQKNLLFELVRRALAKDDKENATD